MRTFIDLLLNNLHYFYLCSKQISIRFEWIFFPRRIDQQNTHLFNCSSSTCSLYLASEFIFIHLFWFPVWQERIGRRPGISNETVWHLISIDNKLVILYNIHIDQQIIGKKMLSAALKVAHRHKILGTVPGSIFAFSCAKNFLVGQVPFHAERLQIAAKVWNDHIIRLPSVVSLISRVISSNCASVICSIYYAIEIDWALTLTEMRACVWSALIKWNSFFASDLMIHF